MCKRNHVATVKVIVPPWWRGRSQAAPCGVHFQGPLCCFLAVLHLDFSPLQGVERQSHSADRATPRGPATSPQRPEAERPAPLWHPEPGPHRCTGPPLHPAPVLRPAGHAAGQVRDAAPGTGRGRERHPRDCAVRTVAPCVLRSPVSLRAHGPGRPPAEEARPEGPTQGHWARPRAVARAARGRRPAHRCSARDACSDVPRRSRARADNRACCGTRASAKKARLNPLGSPASDPSCLLSDDSSLIRALVSAYEGARHLAASESHLGLDEGGLAPTLPLPPFASMPSAASAPPCSPFALVRSRRVLELRGTGMWLEFTRSELCADRRRRSVPLSLYEPRLHRSNDASGDEFEMVTLLTNFVSDLQPRRLP